MKTHPGGRQSGRQRCQPEGEKEQRQSSADAQQRKEDARGGKHGAAVVVFSQHLAKLMGQADLVGIRFERRCLSDGLPAETPAQPTLLEDGLLQRLKHML